MMRESESMKEIRKIRDENSLRHISMSQEERKRESEESIKWLSEKLGKPLKVIKV